MVSLMAFQDLALFSYSFDGVYSNPLLSLTMSSGSFIFCNPQLGNESLFFLFMSPFTPQNIYHHLNHSTCYIAGFLHWCIYTLQHIPEDGSFYFV